jgi:uncharacterized protein (TIGR02246 family)
MHKVVIVAGLWLSALGATAVYGQAKTDPGSLPAVSPAPAAAAPASPSRAEDEKAIRRVIAACGQAYNAHNARAMAALFAPNAEIVNEDGERTQGRQAIEQVFAAAFQAHPQGRIEFAVEGIHFVGTAVAIEDGVSTVVHEPNAAAEKNHYVVVHVKQDGNWQMASARELPDQRAAGAESLEDLAWLIGDWVDESPEAMIATSYRWTDNHKFILSDFRVQRAGQPLMSGTQRIGWDPLEGKIRSWVFDSEGGFGEALWTRKGNQWIVKRTGVTRDGKFASATSILTSVGKDRMTWQSHDRIVGGEITPDIEETPIVRKPPPPM